MSFVGYLALVLGPWGGVSRTWTQLQQAAAASQRIFELLDEPERVVELPQPRRLRQCQGRVTFENVWFAYEPGHVGPPRGSTWRWRPGSGWPWWAPAAPASPP